MTAFRVMLNTPIRRSVLALSLSTAALIGCEEKSAQPAPVQADAEAPKPAVDPNVSRALAAASAQAPEVGKADGPPPSGVFPPGEADKRFAKAGLPTVQLGEEGSGDKISLAEELPKPGTKQSMSTFLAFQPGPQVPPIEIGFDLAFEFAKPKEEGASGVDVLVKVTGTTPGPTVGGDLVGQIKALKGSQLRYRMAPGGGGYGLTIELAKTAAPDLEDLLRSVADNLLVNHIAMPDKPVGEGAIWMTVSRSPYQGMDVLVYRMVKVLGIDGKGGAGTKLRLKVDSKYYAADPSIRRPGIPAEVNPVVRQFRSEGEATVQVELGKPIHEGVTTLTTAIMMTDSADPSKQMSMQGSSQLVLGEQGKRLMQEEAAAIADELE